MRKIKIFASIMIVSAIFVFQFFSAYAMSTMDHGHNACPFAILVKSGCAPTDNPIMLAAHHIAVASTLSIALLSLFIVVLSITAHTKYILIVWDVSRFRAQTIRQKYRDSIFRRLVRFFRWLICTRYNPYAPAYGRILLR